MEGRCHRDFSHPGGLCGERPPGAWQPLFLSHSFLLYSEMTTTCLGLRALICQSDEGVGLDKCISNFFFFFLLRAVPTACGSSQAIAAGLHHSHSNIRSEPRLQPTPQLMATPDP